MRKHYSEYVRHCLRFYIATLEVGTAPKFKTAADRTNWLCCRYVVENLDQNDLDFVKQLYSPGDTVPDKVYALAKEHKMSQSYLWSLMDDLEYKIAKKRGLI